MTNQTDLFTIVFDGASRAAFRILRERKGHVDIDLDLFALVAKPVYTDAGERLIEEWRDLLAANFDDNFKSAFVEAQALELGIEVANRYHDEMQWASFEFAD